MKEYANLNDNELIYMIGENNEEANNLMFEKYRPLIYKIASKYYIPGKYGIEKEDLVQEGYLGLFNAINGYDVSKDNTFYTYAVRCISSKMINLLTVSSSSKNMVLNESLSLNKGLKDEEDTFIDYVPDIKTNIDLIFEKQEQMYRLKKKLYSLPIEESCILELYYNGFKFSDIAKLLDIRMEKIKYSMYRIKKKLKVEKKD